MEASRPAIDLPKLNYLIKQGVSAIPVDKVHEEAVLCIGDTGVGKSTILSYLNGAQFTVKLEGMKAVLDTKDAKGLKIGHDRYS
jgi:ABC-type phosphate/phosphonate transport system ATPase subunit